MKAKSCVALATVGVLAWSVIYQGKASRHPDSSWRDVEAGGRSFASWAQDALAGAGEQSGQVARGLGHKAREQGLSWPGFLAQGQAISASQIAVYEKQLCDLANRERVQRGLPALKISPALAQVARAHSREMAAKNYFAHESPTPGLKTPLDRYRATVHKSPRLIAENIYKLEGSGLYRLKPTDFRGAHTGWMHSPGHRANILRTSPAGGPTQIGVGIVVRNNAFWATQNFARP